MKHIEKATRRLVRQLQAIDKGLFLQLLRELLSEHGVTSYPVFGLPRLWSVCEERSYSAQGELTCAYAAPWYPCFYTPAIMRCARKQPFELVLLHTYCHEMFHYLGRRPINRMPLESAGNAVGSITNTLTGFQIDTTIDIGKKVPTSAFHFFNEGVTELLGREFTNRVAYRVNVLNVDEEGIACYLRAIEDDCGFYQGPVAFVRALVKRFATSSKMEPKLVLDWLVQSYVRGTNLRTDPTWNDYTRMAGFDPFFTSRLENASEEQLGPFAGELLQQKVRSNPVFGHDMDDIEVVPA